VVLTRLKSHSADLQNSTNRNSEIEHSEGQQEPIQLQEDDVTKETLSKGTAKQIVFVPPGKYLNEPFLDINEVTPKTLNEFSSFNLDLAISGDLDAAYNVLLARNRCNNAPRTPKGIELRVLQKLLFAQKLIEKNKLFDTDAPESPDKVFPTERENLANQKRWHQACRKQVELFDESLRNRLDSLAQQGHVVARYLYAIWPPEYLNYANAFLLQQEWESKAREYSMLNLEAGEVAGLLAFGNSYLSTRLFTRYDIYMGYGLYKAAFECGFSGQGVQSVVNIYFNFEHLPESLWNRQPEVLTIAERLQLMYCP